MAMDVVAGMGNEGDIGDDFGGGDGRRCKY